MKSVAASSSAVVAGKALPEEWSKPIVYSVMLPAHAATTIDVEATTVEPTAFRGGNPYTIQLPTPMPRS